MSSCFRRFAKQSKKHSHQQNPVSYRGGGELRVMMKKKRNTRSKRPVGILARRTHLLGNVSLRRPSCAYNASSSSVARREVRRRSVIIIRAFSYSAFIVRFSELKKLWQDTETGNRKGTAVEKVDDTGRRNLLFEKCRGI